MKFCAENQSGVRTLSGTARTAYFSEEGSFANSKHLRIGNLYRSRRGYHSNQSNFLCKMQCSSIEFSVLGKPSTSFQSNVTN